MWDFEDRWNSALTYTHSNCSFELDPNESKTIDVALTQLTTRVLPLCEHYVAVNNFIESRRRLVFGKVFHSLSSFSPSCGCCYMDTSVLVMKKALLEWSFSWSQANGRSITPWLLLCTTSFWNMFCWLPSWKLVFAKGNYLFRFISSVELTQNDRNHIEGTVKKGESSQGVRRDGLCVCRCI